MVASEAFEMPVSCKECIFHSNYGMCQLSGYFEDEDYTNTERSVDCPLVEAIPKDQYEARLKADLKAILVELQMEIEELCINNPLAECEEDMNRGIEKAVDVIQEKINALKGENKNG